MQHTLIVGLVALVVGFVGGHYTNTASLPAASGMPETMSMDHTMDNMTAGLDGKTGDAFDQAFIEGMIAHHEGAVVMSQRALQSAKHDEIKELANMIIAAQTQEITMMREWIKEWYGIEESDADHVMR